MKFFLALALIAAVASAGVIKPALITEEMQQISEIIAAINSPSTDPATAALLEQMLYESLGLSPISIGPAIIEPESPISVGPAFVEPESPISVGPAFVDFESPIAVGPAFVDDIVHEIVAPGGAAETPAGPAPPAAQKSPLVQIIVNVNANSAPGAEPVGVVDNTPVIPAQVAEEVTPVQVVDEAVNIENIVIPAPIVLPELVAPIVVEPIQIAEPVLPGTVQEVDRPTPIAVGEPVLPIPVHPVVLPEILN